MATREATARRQGVTTTVEVRCTGHVYDAVGDTGFAFDFEGETLRAFLEAFFVEHPEVEEMVIAADESEATTSGWAPVDDPPGTWRKNPEGERTSAYARVLVNGRFNENRDGFDTELSDGDRVALVYPFIFCC